MVTPPPTMFAVATAFPAESVPGVAPDGEKKYPTGKVGHGRVTILVGVAVPSIFVIGLPYIVPVNPNRAGTVNVSCCPLALAARPMYVVVITFALPLVVAAAAMNAGALAVMSPGEPGDVEANGDVGSWAARAWALARMSAAIGFLHFSVKGVRRVVGLKGRLAVQVWRMQAIVSRKREVWRAVRQKPRMDH